MKSQSTFNFKSTRGCTRREFLTGCLVSSTPLFFHLKNPLGISSGFATSPTTQPEAEFSRPKIRLVFSHIPPDRPTWPNIGYNYEGRKKELLTKLTRALPEIDFLPVTVQSQKEAETLLQQDKDIDGYVIYLLGIWTGATRTIAASGRPVVLVDDLFAGSGEFLIEYANARRAGLKVYGVASSRFEDAVEAISCFSALKKMKATRILDVTDSPGFWGKPDKIKQVLGPEVIKIGSTEINEAYQKADRKIAETYAQKWIKEAEKIIEPDEAEIRKSGLMYAALLDLMQKHRARAITIDCLTLFYSGKLPAYPCLGFCQLNNDGLVGACEGDLQSTTMMLLATYLAGRPGYISDPVIDMAKNEIIYAHCVAPTRVFGLKGPANPYRIRNHSEDRKGAAIQSLLPVGELVTTFEINGDVTEMVIHQARTTGNVEEDKACRTKLAARPEGDLNRLLNEWDRFGWHRVTVFGDLKKKLEAVCSLTGIKLINEA